MFLKNYFLFVRIRSMQVGFEDWKQVAFFIKHSRSNVVKKFSRLLLSIVRLKSPVNIVLSYWQENSPDVFDKWSIKYFSFWDGGLHIPTHSHLWFLTVNYNRFNSMSIGMDSKDRTGNFFIDIKHKPSSKPVSILSKYLVTIYLKLLFRK